jgi:hypothetical protein
MWIYLLYIIKDVLYRNSYDQNILQTDESTIICMIFGINNNTIQYLWNVILALNKFSTLNG